MRYEIKGDMMPVVELRMEPGESIKCEGGAMLWMSDNMQMETSGGGVSKMFGKMLTSEKLFHNIYTAIGHEGMISFGSCFPGNIMAVKLSGGKSIICQKSAYLASTMGVNLEIAFQKKVSAGFFGGEGFIMQRLSGEGLVFLEIDGSAIEYELAPGERMIIDTGHLAMMDSTCTMSVETVKGGMKNVFLGGEGLFNTVVEGPGKVTVQTMPKSQLARLISSLTPSKS